MVATLSVELSVPGILSSAAIASVAGAKELANVPVKTSAPLAARVAALSVEAKVPDVSLTLVPEKLAVAGESVDESVPVNISEPDALIVAALKLGAIVPVNTSAPLAAIVAALSVAASAPVNTSEPLAAIVAALSDEASVPVNTSAPAILAVAGLSVEASVPVTGEGAPPVTASSNDI